jgi:hypothetical protein
MPAETQKNPSSIDDHLDPFGLLAGLGTEYPTSERDPRDVPGRSRSAVSSAIN